MGHRIAKYGSFSVYAGKLGEGDSRGLDGTGPTRTGRIAPLASCWNEPDARARARDMSRAHDLGEGCEDCGGDVDTDSTLCSSCEVDRLQTRADYAGGDR